MDAVNDPALSPRIRQHGWKAFTPTWRCGALPKRPEPGPTWRGDLFQRGYLLLGTAISAALAIWLRISRRIA